MKQVFILQAGKCLPFWGNSISSSPMMHWVFANLGKRRKVFHREQGLTLVLNLKGQISRFSSFIFSFPSLL